jgi:nicotinamide-nucleotide amidase
VIALPVFNALKARGWMLVTAESCTGGMVAAAITDIAGSSNVFDRGFVTYSNAAKTDMLGVSAELIARVGAVSAEVAQAMAEGALDRSGANVGISVTGIAGPGGGSPGKPVGLVHFACAVTARPTRLSAMSFGDLGRDAVRRAALQQAFSFILETIEKKT